MAEKIQLPLRTLGNTDIDISALGLEIWQFSGGEGLIGGQGAPGWSF